VLVRSRIFTPPYRPDRLWGPPNLLLNGYGGGGGSFQRIKRKGREVDYSSPTSAEVNKTWIYATTPPYVFIA
jgi:hypothetical protein